MSAVQSQSFEAVVDRHRAIIERIIELRHMLIEHRKAPRVEWKDKVVCVCHSCAIVHTRASWSFANCCWSWRVFAREWRTSVSNLRAPECSSLIPSYFQG